MSSDDITQRDRFRGALLGLAVGDALGTTVEFRRPGTFEPVTDMVGGGPFGLPPGAFTDDTSMALCLAESLVERQGFDPVDQLRRYVRWYREGHLSSTGSCFDIGNATRGALNRFERHEEPFPGDHDPDAAGNGPLMKLAPVALAFAHHPEVAVVRAAESARTTHGAPQAADACRYFAGLLVGALRGETVSMLLHQDVFEPAPGLWVKAPLHPEVAEVAAGSFHHKQPPAIRGGGYVVQALEAALWALAKTRTFEDGVLAAVNLGDDADTTAAIYGQLAGAFYGVEAIPRRWRERVVMAEPIIELADRLHELAARIDPDVPPARSRSWDQAAGRSPTRLPDGASPPPPGDSYWVVDGRLLAGPYPGAREGPEAEAKLEALLDIGVTCFLDLTEEGEGPPLRPYSKLLRRLASRRGLRVAYVRLPIRDVDTPLSWQMRSILATIRFALAEGETVYLHCWGGVGRTGTVVGCLAREAGVPADEVLDRIAEMRSHTERAYRISPETSDQRAFVEAWEDEERTLVLDQQALDRLGVVPVPTEAAPVPTQGEIVAELEASHPVVIEGPGPGWCVQALADAARKVVRVEVLDPEYWGSGPPLPEDQQRIIEGLGLGREIGMWSNTLSDEESMGRQSAAELMLTVAERAWGIAGDE